MAGVLKNTRWRVYERDGFACVYCGRDVVPWTFDPDHFATVDHVVPKVAGGSNRFHNLVTACLTCNQAKGDASALQFAGAAD